jgi:hypothetical protein
MVWVGSGCGWRGGGLEGRLTDSTVIAAEDAEKNVGRSEYEIDASVRLLFKDRG